MPRASHVALAAVLILLSTSALASSASQWGFVSALDEFRDVMTGPVARTIGIIGVFACGAGLVWGGEMNQFLKSAVYTVLVVCFIICATNFVDWLSSLSGSSISSGAQVAVAAPSTIFV